ncbi:elongation factor P--(R)-beta-lysine ligase [Neptunicella marina]|uniref:Elongation factor P--(R)-beta-lysine ligase n=1 Tax=Neptunicella marina TaxID=2125989 RepID=A0A8J6IUS9_9ALTE|nr:elongation factor P--(R)-beta-lysine ligase [Neptunicella marina]MBC3766594.1 elongation factor P--(R)-beta-lysine ligase [Neptunicella marina]
MTSSNWQPTASIDTLKQRAKIIAQIRQFFADRNVTEVETPQLALHGVSDPYLVSFKSRYVGPESAEGRDLYLQTSPEYAMKRLLCAGSGCIYQLAKAYRNEEGGRLHNPEFTMLEWYRIGFDHFALMDEMAELLQGVLGCDEPERMSYQKAFMRYLNCDPLAESLESIRQRVMDLGVADYAAEETDKDALLQLLFNFCIEPEIGQQQPCFIYHFPASQAALAKIHSVDPRVAERFEVYFKGIELANGFHELADAHEQAERFAADNAKRLALGVEMMQPDQNLLSALEHGLPDCAGVALGIDRLIMQALGKTQLQDVMAFTVKNG